MTNFVGRRHELAAVRNALSTSRLVTLTGVGGVGKTRLAMQAARKLDRAFGDGVWLVQLAELGDAALIPHTMAAALEVPERSTREPLNGLVDHLRDRHLLLVVDNCEHVAEPCASVINTLLRSAPDLRVLATSRHLLGVDGEQVLWVPPLPVPDRDAGFPASKGAPQVEALTLFTDRVSAVVPGFAVTEANWADVVQICRRLDGIPLALELAAPYLRVLSPHELVARLNDWFRSRSEDHPTLPPRHQTLQSVVDWSFELCSRQEQALWARLSVFAGSFDLEAVETVCTGGDVDDGLAGDVIVKLMAGLVGKSVLLREQHGDTARFRLLETMRQYGQLRLEESGQEQIFQTRHRDHYLSLAERSEAEWFGPDQLAKLATLRREHANLQAALDYCLTTSDPTHAGLQMVGILAFYWMSGGTAEGRHWLDRALAHDTSPTEERVRALWAGALIAMWQGDFQAVDDLCEECRLLAGELGDESGLMHAHAVAGLVSFYRGDLARAHTLGEEATTLHRSLGELGLLVLVRAPLVLAKAFQGNLDRAVSLAQEALDICRAHTESYNYSFMQQAYSVALWGEGVPSPDRCRQGIEYLRESLRIKQAFAEIPGILGAITYMSWFLAVNGDETRAARMFGFVQRAWEEEQGIFLFGSDTYFAIQDGCATRVRQRLGDEVFEEEFSRGTELTLIQAVAYALGEKPESPSAATASNETASPLTRRERQVAELAAQGLSNKQIAAALVIAQRTAEGHIENILSKLNLTSRAQIAAWSHRQE
ncbi:ATP-binding protein [Actinomadura coerulea]|uniref:ATP-binding protein n=1 Tax=Actinomadura coerulea TaxID=46159 RepID=UPI00342C0E81